MFDEGASTVWMFSENDAPIRVRKTFGEIGREQVVMEVVCPMWGRLRNWRTPYKRRKTVVEHGERDLTTIRVSARNSVAGPGQPAIYIQAHSSYASYYFTYP